MTVVEMCWLAVWLVQNHRDTLDAPHLGGSSFSDNDEIERVRNFVIKQQETFAESMSKSDARMTRLESAFVGLFNMVNETG